MILDSIIEAGSPTPLVRLSPRTARGIKAEILLKLEGALPSGTSADRVAMALAEEALRGGEEKEVNTLVVACRSGNMALALARVAAVRGLWLIAALPDRIGEEKVRALKALGARVHLCPASLDQDREDSFHRTAERLAREVPRAVLVDPLCADAAPRLQGETAGAELLAQVEGRLDLLVVPLESGSTATGLGRVLKERIPGLRLVGVEPEGALYRDFFKFGRVGRPGATLVEGAGSDRIAGTLDTSVLDDLVQVPDRDALLAARRLARKEGILAGGVGGLALAAALQEARELEEGKRVAVIIPDSGLYHLSRIYNDAWMQANQILDGAADRTLFDVLSVKFDDPGALHSITPDEPLHEAVAKMKRNAVSQLPVLTREGSPVGSLWEGMVIDLMVQGRDTRAMTVREAMAEPFPIMEMETPIAEAARHFGQRVPAILVRRQEGDFAIITKHDLLQGLTS